MSVENSVPLELAVAVPTFIGSLMSFLATTTAIVFHIVYPPQRHFRHALVINLLVADFINSLNNTISGGIYLRWGRTGNPDMSPSTSCIANGWIGQLSVQTVDFTILIISISVLSVVMSKSPTKQPSLRATIATCAAAWIPGIITSNVALGYNVYGHVSGNWCWILPDPRFRYGLTHGWRIAIFIATIGIYTTIYIHLKRVFNRIRMTSNMSSEANATKDREHEMSAGARWRISAPVPQANFHNGGVNNPATNGIPLRPPNATRKPDLKYGNRSSEEEDSEGNDVTLGDGSSTLGFAADGRRASTDEEALPHISHRPGNRTTVGGGTNVSASAAKGASSSRMPAAPNLKRMLLLNGYPIAYIILWIPGMANRLVEVVNGSSPVWLRALQASTQFVGLANAVTYGLNEQARGSWARWWKAPFGKA